MLAPLLIAVVTAGGGCSRKQPDSAAPEPAAPPATPEQSAPGAANTATIPRSGQEWPAGVLHASYWECAGGLEFVLKNLWRENAVTLELHEGSRRLEHVPSASGAKYADQSIEFWTKGGAGLFQHKPAAQVKCSENRARSLIEDARARGVVFRGLGNEPGWMVEVGPVTSLVFETNYGAERHEFPNATSGGELAAGRTWRAVQDGQTIEVMVKQEACQDDMSGQPYEYSFRVTFAGTTLQGCGARLQRG
jgi:uncharacterized membrane protein